MTLSRSARLAARVPDRHRASTRQKTFQSCRGVAGLGLEEPDNGRIRQMVGNFRPYLAVALHYTRDRRFPGAAARGTSLRVFRLRGLLPTTVSSASSRPYS